MLWSPARAIRSAASRYREFALSIACTTPLVAHSTGPGDLSGSGEPACGALSVLAGGAVAVRRRAPLALPAAVAAGMCAVAAGVLPRRERARLGRRRHHRRLHRGLEPGPATRQAGAVLTVGLVATWILGDLSHVHLDTRPAIGHALFAAVPWFFGRAIGRRRERERGIEQRALILERGAEQLARRAVADERVRIAPEIHDVVTSSPDDSAAGLSALRSC